jgi:hypothetical protein
LIEGFVPIFSNMLSLPSRIFCGFINVLKRSFHQAVEVAANPGVSRPAGLTAGRAADRITV